MLDKDDNAITVNVTGSKLIEYGAWDKYCVDYGINPCAINEGLIDGGDRIEISLEQASKYGIISGPRGKEVW